MAESGNTKAATSQVPDLDAFWKNVDATEAEAIPRNLGEEQQKIVAGQKVAATSPDGLKKVTTDAAVVAQKQRKDAPTGA